MDRAELNRLPREELIELVLRLQELAGHCSLSEDCLAWLSWEVGRRFGR